MESTEIDQSKTVPVLHMDHNNVLFCFDWERRMSCFRQLQYGKYLLLVVVVRSNQLMHRIPRNPKFPTVAQRVDISRRRLWDRMSHNLFYRYADRAVIMVNDYIMTEQHRKDFVSMYLDALNASGPEDWVPTCGTKRGKL